MATEGNQIRDGAQMQAAANYWNPSTALYGQAGSGQFLAVSVTAARTVTIVAAAASTTPIYGILQNMPDIGQAADVCVFGVTKYVAGAAVTAGAELMIDSAQAGRLITWVTGSHNYSHGIALDTVAAANAIGTMMLFINSYRA
jgi:hypothetical protein